MKYLFIIVGLLIVAFPSDKALGQSQSEALVTGLVDHELALLTIDGDWGLFASGTTYVITPSGFKDPPGPSEGPGIVVTPAGFEINGNPGSNVQISFILPSSFTSDDESGELPVSNWTYGWNYDSDPGGTFNGAGYVAGNSLAVTIGGNASSGLFLGASVLVPSTSFPGTYTAQIIGSVAYIGN